MLKAAWAEVFDKSHKVDSIRSVDLLSPPEGPGERISFRSDNNGWVLRLILLGLLRSPRLPLRSF